MTRSLAITLSAYILSVAAARVANTIYSVYYSQETRGVTEVVQRASLRSWWLRAHTGANPVPRIMSNVPQIMVCCPTYAKSADTATLLLQGLAEQTYPNLVFVFCDTTSAAMPGKTYEKLSELLQKFLPNKLTVILKTAVPAGASAHQIITEAREQLRKYFLQSNAEYLFFVDDDIKLPPDAIEKLAGHKQPAMVGTYLNPMVLREGKEPEIAPCAWVDIPKEAGLHPDIVRPLGILEVMPQRIIPITISGFGCSLFHRSVMDIQFIYNTTTTEDTPFFLSLRKKGIQPLLDTRVKCKHYKFHPLDERNNRLDFGHYKLQYVP